MVSRNCGHEPALNTERQDTENNYLETKGQKKCKKCKKDRLTSLVFKRVEASNRLQGNNLNDCEYGEKDLVPE